jgi:hypothetical protein
MVPFTELLFPILLSAVFVFIVSSILHMVVQMHTSDCQKIPGEDKFLQAMRPKEMGTPEMIEKFNQGPVGFMTVTPNGMPNMGKSLGLWFAYTIVIGIFVAYIAGMGLERGAGFMAVFSMTAASAILGYAVPAVVDSIWKGQKWSITGKFIFDGLCYGLTTAATFAWLWPAAA